MTMIMMPARAATWLELVTLPAQSHTDRPAVSVHSLDGEFHGCLAVTLRGRLVHTTTGRLSVFRSLDAVQRFLSLAGIMHWCVGLPLQGLAPQREKVECLQLGGGVLRSCERCGKHAGKHKHQPMPRKFMPIRQEPSPRMSHAHL
ncbi:MAG: hypothetical protein HGA47_04740 [Zoogloea sp.]|nr:hypothetical protein [Zoogloea sp.]